MNREEKLKELKRIRLKFQASRKQFGEVFVGRSYPTIISYEVGRTEVPESVMMLARVWESFYDKIKGNFKCQK